MEKLILEEHRELQKEIILNGKPMWKEKNISDKGYRQHINETRCAKKNDGFNKGEDR